MFTTTAFCIPGIRVETTRVRRVHYTLEYKLCIFLCRYNEKRRTKMKKTRTKASLNVDCAN